MKRSPASGSEPKKQRPVVWTTDMTRSLPSPGGNYDQQRFRDSVRWSRQADAEALQQNITDAPVRELFPGVIQTTQYRNSPIPLSERSSQE